MTPFRQVSRQVAMNPVARAVSKKLLVDALRDFQIRVHLMNDGEDATADVESAMKALAVCLHAMEIIGQADNPACRVIRGAQSALLQCAMRRFRWRALDATAVDQGLQCVADIYPQLPANVMTAAWKKQRDLEAQAAVIREAQPA